MITRESVIDFLKEIKATCENDESGCESCSLNDSDKGCALDVFNLTEAFCPSEWKIEEDLI